MDKIREALENAEDALSRLRFALEAEEIVREAKHVPEAYGLSVTAGADVMGGTAGAKREAFNEKVREATVRARQGGFDPDEHILGMTPRELANERQFPTGTSRDENLAIIGAINRRYAQMRLRAPSGHGMGADGRQS